MATAQDIKDKIDIVEFLRGYVELKPAGKNFKALCPFHKEKTPSFMVSPDRRTWHCFGSCSEGGDVIKFLMKYENIEFFEALKILAEKAGVELGRYAHDQRQFDALYAINAAAAEFFETILNREEAAPVLRYLRERGLSDETAKTFRLGLAPTSSDLLSRHLTKKGFAIIDIERAGLVFKTERGTYWDRFRGRIMFPIANHFGKVVGFTGRLMPGAAETEAGKYVNSPETPIFQKSKLLYGFYKTKDAIREAKSAVLVEGQMDFLMAHQAGIKNAAATSGTAFTNEHAKVLRRNAETLTFLFDRDEAGQRATERAIDVAHAHDFAARVVDYQLLAAEDALMKDPADLARMKPAALPQLIASAMPAMEYYFSRYLGASFAKASEAKAGEDRLSRKRGVRMALGKIKKLASAVERDEWLKNLAKRTGASEHALLEEMESLPSLSSEVSTAVGMKEAASSMAETELGRKERIAERLLTLAAASPACAELMTPHLSLLGEADRAVFAHFASSAPLEGEAKTRAGLVSLRASWEIPSENHAALAAEARKLLNELRRETLKEEGERLSALIRLAEKSGDEAGLHAHLAAFQKVAEELHALR